MMRLAAIVAMFALTACAGTAISLLSDDSARAGEMRAQAKVIADTRSNDFRVRLKAIRQRVDGPDTATVKIAAYERSGGSWRQMGRAWPVGQPGGWFWHVVTDRYGVRKLKLSRPGGECPDRVALRLLMSPSSGPSATFRFATCDDRFRPVDV